MRANARPTLFSSNPLFPCLQAYSHTSAKNNNNNNKKKKKKEKIFGVEVGSLKQMIIFC